MSPWIRQGVGSRLLASAARGNWPDDGGTPLPPPLGHGVSACEIGDSQISRTMRGVMEGEWIQGVGVGGRKANIGKAEEMYSNGRAAPAESPSKFTAQSG